MEVYVKLKTKVLEKLFAMVSMLPVVSPPFVLSLSMIMLFGRSGIIDVYKRQALWPMPCIPWGRLHRQGRFWIITAAR